MGIIKKEFSVMFVANIKYKKTVRCGTTVDRVLSGLDSDPY